MVRRWEGGRLELLGVVCTLAGLAALAWADPPAPQSTDLKSPAPLSAQAAEANRQFWAFLPLQHAAPPEVKHAAWVKTPIDRFLLAQMEAKGLQPNAEAERRTLIRRVTFDLIGLPPTPEEVDAFVADPAPDAYERLVDRLLANPHFGERWGRHWLDLVRYADSDGFEADRDRPNAYPYRDFIIKAFNSDMPYNRFVRWQLAGDELAPGDPNAWAATGFGTAGVHSVFTVANEGTPLEREQMRYDELDDMLATTGAAFLGLTVGCARCHDHKFDPIPQRDYYRMLAAFTTTRREERPLATAEEIARYQQQLKAFETRMEPLEQQRKALLAQVAQSHKVREEEAAKYLDATQQQTFAMLNQAIAEAYRQRPADLPQALGLTDSQPTPAVSYLLARGEADKKVAQVELGFLTVLSPPGEPVVVHRPEHATTTFQRAALADWMTDTDHGAGRLLARVIVNRLWQHHFGEGLVRTPNDFGVMGERPTHPELLDWLATELIRNGWQLKPIHHLILTSAAYRQSGAFDPQRAAADPDNRLLWHRRPLRLEAEALRDSILAVSGHLNTTLYGPAIKPAIPAEAMAGRNKDDPIPRPRTDGPEQWRRSIYLFTKRSLTTPQLETFDAPNASASCGKRTVSTVATQALLLLNDAFVRNQAKLFAQRLAIETDGTPTAEVERAYRLALSRPPTPDERKLATDFLNGQDKGKALTNFCHVLLTLNEFMYVD